jgi:Flp pilus assembly protein CpaB
MRRGRILILLGLILAVGTAAAVFILLQGATQQAAAPEVARKSVVVAAQPIPEGEPVDGRLEVKDVPVEVIPEGALFDLSHTTGMLAAGPIPQGTIVQPDLLISPQQLASQGELGKLVEVGFEAVAFPIDELSSVSYGIQPGDDVDVLMTFSFVDVDQDSQILQPICPPQCPSVTGEEQGALSTDQRSRLVAQLTVQDARVLGVGRWSFAAPAPEATSTPPQGETPQAEPPEYITLMLSPQDALVLKLAREYGASIDLAVRAQDDHQVFTTQQVTLDYVLARFGISLPAKQPYGIENLGRGVTTVP